MNCTSQTAEYSWSDIDRMTRTLAKMIVADEFFPEAIVGILRGGCIPAIQLSHLLGTRAFYALQVQTTTSNEVRSERHSPLIIEHNSLTTIEDKRVLVVDDVVNRGVTLVATRDYLQQYSPTLVRIAVLLWDTVLPSEAQSIDSKIVDYHVEAVHAWVVFPWEK